MPSKRQINMSNVLVVAQSKVWNPDLISNLRKAVTFEVVEITESHQLNFGFLNELKPKFVFFPHWSSIVSKDIYENFECIIFHMADLPFGRGGSPLQNLIARGFTETKVSAIKCIAEIDSGPIYLKKALSLDGSAQEIFARAAKVIQNMIVEILKSKPQPTEQVGEVVIFKRRTPSESEISRLRSVDELYNFIRMLDADGYPHAFIDCGEFRIEFRNARLLNGCLLADSSFIKNDAESERT